MPVVVLDMLHGKPHKRPRRNYETVLVQAILVEFGARTDMFIWRSNTGAARGRRGIVKFNVNGCADVTGVLRGGRFLAIEIKAPGRDQSADQIVFEAAVVAQGGLYILARSVDDVRQVLDPLLGPA